MRNPDELRRAAPGFVIRISRLLFATAVVLSSGGVGYVASQIWPLPGHSGAGTEAAPVHVVATAPTDVGPRYLIGPRDAEPAPAVPASVPRKDDLTLATPPVTASPSPSAVAALPPEKPEADQPASVAPAPASEEAPDAKPPEQAPAATTTSSEPPVDAPVKTVKQDTPGNVKVVTKAFQRPALARRPRPPDTQSLPPLAPSTGFAHNKAMSAFMGYAADGH